MTAQEFLYYTVHHYNSNNRCTDGQKCTYSPITIDKKNSEGCAIGRWLDPDLAYQIDTERSGINSIINYIIDIYPFPEWMKRMNINFLKDVQSLHDTHEYWDSNGINKYGKNKVKSICEEYNLDYEQLNLN